MRINHSLHVACAYLLIPSVSGRGLVSRSLGWSSKGINLWLLIDKWHGMNARTAQDPFLGLLTKIMFLTVIAALAKPHDVIIGVNTWMVKQVSDDGSRKVLFEHNS